MTFRMLSPLRNLSLMQAQDPFVSLQRDLDRVMDTFASFSGVPSAVAARTLRLDVKEDENSFTVTADLPGLSEKDVEVTFEDQILTIRGEKKLEREEKGQTWHITERSSGSFVRQLGLPTNIDENAISAQFEKGVLTVKLPKAPETKAASRKIEVKAAQ